MSRYCFEAVIFDLDGVITKTALLHAKAWKQMFDEYLHLRQKRYAEPFREFTHEADYLPYVDGRPRYEGVKNFLQSRHIDIPFGVPSDAPDKETVCGLGNKKNLLFRQLLKKEGVEVYPSSIQFIKSLLSVNIRIGVASSSKNCQDILQSADIEDLFQTRVDGLVCEQLGLKGKPQPDIFVRAARNLGTTPGRSVVIEDAISGVEAGRNGGFGLVLGVARKSNQVELMDSGADIVVDDLSGINIEEIQKWFCRKPKPLFESWDEVRGILGKKKPVFFLDYDGTLTPIVERPELAIMQEDMRDIVRRLSERYTVAIVSGRMRKDVENLVGVKGIFYAGSHGFDIKGPGFSMVEARAKEVIPVISQIASQLKEELGRLEGILIEEKRFSVAVHYRLVKQIYLERIKRVVDNIIRLHKSLRLMSGKKVFEILPDIDWDKGRAVRWIIEALKISWKEHSVVYLGDDVTDEDAFRVIRQRGVGILVSHEDRPSAAYFRLASVAEVKRLFESVISWE
jgi:alpha,alpha-trehalase